MPDDLLHIWEWYVQLSISLGSGAGLYQEIEAFCRLRRIEMTPWEVSMVWMLHHLNSAIRSNRQGKDKPTATTGAGVISIMRGLKAKREIRKSA